MYIDKPAIYTDYYELMMAQGYYKLGFQNKVGISEKLLNLCNTLMKNIKD